MSSRSESITPRNTDSFKLYLQEVSKIPLLTKEEEESITLRMAQGDEKAFEEIVLHNLRFVITVAKKYQNRGLELEDLVSEGNIGLIVAAKKFDRDRGVKFISYAVWWIRQNIMQALYHGSKTIRLPMSQYVVLNKIYKYMQEFEQKNKRQPDTFEIEAGTGIPSGQVSDLFTLCTKYMSFDTTLTNDETTSTLEEVLPNNDYTIEEKITKDEELEELEEALNCLKVRDKVILKLYFGIGVDFSLKTKCIAEMFNLTGSRILQIINNCKLQLKTKHPELENLMY